MHKRTIHGSVKIESNSKRKFSVISMRIRVFGIISNNIESSLKSYVGSKDKQFLGYLLILFVLLLAISFSLHIKNAKDKEKNFEALDLAIDNANEPNAQNIV